MDVVGWVFGGVWCSKGAEGVGFRGRAQAERQDLGPDGVCPHGGCRFRIFQAVEEVVVFRLGLRNAHFGGGVALHLVGVAVQMVRGDVAEDGDVRTKGVAVVQLKTADFQYVQGFGVPRHLQCEALADVASQAHFQARLLHDVVR